MNGNRKKQKETEIHSKVITIWNDEKDEKILYGLSIQAKVDDTLALADKLTVWILQCKYYSVNIAVWITKFLSNSFRSHTSFDISQPNQTVCCYQFNSFLNLC